MIRSYRSSIGLKSGNEGPYIVLVILGLLIRTEVAQKVARSCLTVAKQPLMLLPHGGRH